MYIEKESKGRIFNHNVENSIGNIFNHDMEDAAPNTKQVFKKDNLGNCADEDELSKLLGVFKYPGRVLGETNSNDIIQLHSDLSAEWKWITNHYDKIGLSYTKNVVWDDDFDMVKKFPDYELSVFFFGLKAHSARPNKKWFDLAEKMNSKNNFIMLCHNLSVDVPKTSCFKDKTEFCCNGIKFPVYLKISTSVSGLGVIKCRDENELKKEISLIEPGIDFQIQEEVKTETFINVQYVINNKCLSRVAITEQILEQSQYVGSKSTDDYEDVWGVTDQLAAKMQQEGMKGYFAFDLAVTEDGKYLAIECNPRYNGSTYPTNIAKKLGVKSYVSKSFETTKTFDELSLGELEYNPTRKSGVIITNWGCISDGKIGVMFVADSNEQRMKIEDEFKKII